VTNVEDAFAMKDYISICHQRTPKQISKEKVQTSFMKDWKVAGAFVSPKNMTRN